MSLSLGGLMTRCPVPGDLTAVTATRKGAEVYPPSVGISVDAVEHIWAAVESLYSSGIHPAISLCLRRRGRVLIDRSIGYQRGNGPADPPDGDKVRATPKTPFCLLSASKPVTAVLLHHLDECGLLRLDDPVCEYIPEFGTRGKQAITIQHLLTHRAGLANPPQEIMAPDLLGDPQQIIAVLCDQEPTSRPGARLAYHAITAGFLLAEVVRRVSGMDARTYLHRILRDPLRMRWLSYGVRPSEVRDVATCAFTGIPNFPPLSLLARRALGMDYEKVVELTNDPRFLTSIFPSANVVATADEVCRFYEMLRRGGELEGVRVLERRTVLRATAEQSYLEPDGTLFWPLRYASGFILGAEWFSLYGPFTRRAFGHLGLSNVIAWADPDRDVSAALLTSGKPLLYPELFFLFEILRRIGANCPEDGSGIGQTALWERHAGKKSLAT